VKEGFLKEYLEADQEDPKGEVALRDQAHETPVHGEMDTIAGVTLGVRIQVTMSASNLSSSLKPPTEQVLT